MENWNIVELQEVCRIINGRAYKKAELLDKGKYRVLRVGNFFTNKQWYYSDLELDEDKYCDNGDLLYAWSASFGPRIWGGEKVIFHYHIWKMEPNEDRILKEYLHKFLLWDTEKIKQEQGVGTTMIHVTKGSMEERELPIPPLPEQKRIVDILDEAFEAIDQAMANVERNIQNAEELFQSKLNEIFSQRGEGWGETTLGEKCSVLNGHAFKSKEATDSSNTQLLRMGNLYQNKLDLERRPVFYPDSYAKEYDKYVLDEGDLIMSLTGTVDKKDYGYTVELPETDVTLLLNQRIMKIIIEEPNLINKSFLKNYLLSPFFLDMLYETASGTRQANLSSRKIMKLPFYYPNDIEKQKKIVDVIHSFKEFADGVIGINNKRLNNIEELKKSILQKAFLGELTANEQVAV